MRQNTGLELIVNPFQEEASSIMSIKCLWVSFSVFSLPCGDAFTKGRRLPNNLLRSTYPSYFRIREGRIDQLI